MIKLFLVALLCVAVFADSPADKFNDMWMKPMEAMADMAQHAMTGQGSSLVRRAAENVGSPTGPMGSPPPPPPHLEESN